MTITTETGFEGSAAPKQSYFSPMDIANIISGAAVSSSKVIGSKREAKAAKKKTQADLLRSIMKRNLDLYRAQSGFSQDVVDYQNQALQEIARGFADSIKGTTIRGR